MTHIFGNLLEGPRELSMITAMIYYSNTARTHSQISKRKKRQGESRETYTQASYALPSQSRIYTHSTTSSTNGTTTNLCNISVQGSPLKLRV